MEILHDPRMLARGQIKGLAMEYSIFRSDQNSPPVGLVIWGMDFFSYPVIYRDYFISHYLAGPTRRE